MTDATFERDMIAYLEQRGWKVTRARKASPRSQRKLLDAHLNGAHRGAHDEACRACRFARTIATHGRHPLNDAPDCALCIDKRTDYLYPSTLVTTIARAA